MLKVWWRRLLYSLTEPGGNKMKIIITENKIDISGFGIKINNYNDLGGACRSTAQDAIAWGINRLNKELETSESLEKQATMKRVGGDGAGDNDGFFEISN